MLGNVLEWTADWYDVYPTGTEIDPTGPSTPRSGKVLRGGSFGRFPGESRAVTRLSVDPSTPDSEFGFRLVLPIN